MCFLLGSNPTNGCLEPSCLWSTYWWTSIVVNNEIEALEDFGSEKVEGWRFKQPMVTLMVWVPGGLDSWDSRKWKGLGFLPIESQPTNLNHQPKPLADSNRSQKKNVWVKRCFLQIVTRKFFSVPKSFYKPTVCLTKIPVISPLTIRSNKGAEKHPTNVFLLHAFLLPLWWVRPWVCRTWR